MNLASMYLNGWGVQQDYVQAHMWASLTTARILEPETEMRNSALAQREPIAGLQ
ncbi:MAG TPA: hypothetical protein VGG99_11930 [Acetobacteraceae bacterium]|jgi:hypothetical protein